MKQLPCALVLALVGLVAGTPQGYGGVKSGAVAKGKSNLASLIFYYRNRLKYLRTCHVFVFGIFLHKAYFRHRKMP